MEEVSYNVLGLCYTITMTTFPISKNQPIDYPTVQKLVTTVNELNTQVNLKSGNSAINREIARTNDVVIVAETMAINGTAVENASQTFTWNIGDIKDVAFKTPPVVTATIISDPLNESVVGNTAYVSISKVSISTAEIRVHFTKSGPIVLSLSLIAVGLSNLN